MGDRLVVELESVQDLKLPCYGGSDAYALLRFRAQKKTGQFQKVNSGKICKWGETFDFDLEGDVQKDCISLDVYMKKKHRHIGQCIISLSEATAEISNPVRRTYPLIFGPGDPKSKNCSGHMIVLLRYFPRQREVEQVQFNPAPQCSYQVSGRAHVHPQPDIQPLDSALAHGGNYAMIYNRPYPPSDNYRTIPRGDIFPPQTYPSAPTALPLYQPQQHRQDLPSTPQPPGSTSTPVGPPLPVDPELEAYFSAYTPSIQNRKVNYN